MAHEMPSSEDFAGFKRTVLQFVEAFGDLARALKAGSTAEPEWAAIERLVDVSGFERVGVFSTGKTERFGWEAYRSFVSRFAGQTEWEATLRHISEDNGRVILELVERNTRDGVMHVANTVTTYEFDSVGRLCHLEVYVMSLD